MDTSLSGAVRDDSAMLVRGTWMPLAPGYIRDDDWFTCWFERYGYFSNRSDQG